MLHRSVVVITIIGCAVAACRDQSRAGARQVESRRVVMNPDTILGATYQGDGFRISIPPDADSASASADVWGFAGTAILGPLVLRSPGDTGSAYLVFVATFPNPAETPLDHWIDSLRRTRNVNVMDDSMNFLYPPDTLSLSGERALLLRPFCGDCQPYEYYLAKDRRIVLLKSIEGGLEAWPRPRAAEMTQKIIRSFRWN